MLPAAPLHYLKAQNILSLSTSMIYLLDFTSNMLTTWPSWCTFYVGALVCMRYTTYSKLPVYYVHLLVV